MIKCLVLVTYISFSLSTLFIYFETCFNNFLRINIKMYETQHRIFCQQIMELQKESSTINEELLR